LRRRGVNHRKELLMEWLEGEGERQERRVPLPPQVGDAAVRGRIEVGIGALVGIMAAGLFVCWLPSAWELAARLTYLTRHFLPPEFMP
jgi:hypothetical protein